MSFAIYSRIRSSAFLVVLAGVCLAPRLAHAAVVIDEVMYDAPGSDTGHEWIEIENTGTDSFDLAAKDLRFFDSGGNHLLKGYQGGTSLSAGSVAVIADKPDVFLKDHAGFSGLLLDSAVSLTASETIGLLTANGTIDSIPYTSTEGAKGDGESLHRSGALFVAGAANPGISGIPAKPAAPAPGSNNGKDAPTANHQESDDTGITAPTPTVSAASVGAAFAGTSSMSRAPLLVSPWFASFLALLVFSATSLILIRKHVRTT